MNIDDFFPIPVGNVTLDLELSKEKLDLIKKEHERSSENVGNKVSDDKFILDIECMKDLKVVLTNYVNEFFKKVFEPNTDIKICITQSWLNWSDNGEYHHLHYHPNSLLSGVLYLDASEGDSINFWNPNNLLGNIRVKSPETGKWNSRHWKCRIKKNDLIIFPSDLRHEVEPRPNMCQGTRLSLSFNTWFKGQVGHPTQVNELRC
jgi:uncharacterized protein (TIGR02466 family)